MAIDVSNPIYPGHPITIAYLITKTFSCFEEASAPTSHGWCRALGDGRIPGAGGPVSAGVQFLEKLYKGDDLKDVVERAREIWRSETSAAYQDKYLAGEEQASQCLPLLDPSWWKPRQRGAILDETRLYRYRLWRPTGSGSGVCYFLMLNPSTADETIDDNTIRKCTKYARAWGYAKLVVVNLFAYRTKDPKTLKKIVDIHQAVGIDNNAYLDEMRWSPLWRADMVVAAWGGDGNHLGRDVIVMNHLERLGITLHCLKQSSSTRSFPMHPLYQRDDLTPQPFRRPSC